MSSINSVHKEYQFYAPTWRMARDLIKGERALKMHDYDMLRSGTHGKIESFGYGLMPYIPMPCPADMGQENLLRYATYIERAALFNFTRRTEQGMGGMVFMKEPVEEFPPDFDYISYDVDGCGIGIAQQAREVLNDVLETGREGLLVDYPQTDAPVSVGDAESTGIKARIVLYKAETILDWRVDTIGALEKLIFVKLVETVETVSDADIFKVDCKKQYRVLLLEDGRYLQRVYDQDGHRVGDDITPLNGMGQQFTYIPFFFVGAETNRPECDPPPLSEIAALNVKHYRNSADWEESSFMVGQPTPVFAGLTEQWIKAAWGDSPVRLGSRAAVPLPAGGSAQLLQAAPNSMPEMGMKHKEQQALALGARLITPGGQAETAEAVRIKHASDASVLKTVVRNINEAYANALYAVAEFMAGATTDAVFTLSTEFIADSLTGEQVTALVAAWQMGAISKPVLDAKMLAGGVIPDGTDIDAMNESIAEGFTGTNLGGGF